MRNLETLKTSSSTGSGKGGERKGVGEEADILWDRKQVQVLSGRCPGSPRGLRLAVSWRERS